MNRSKGFVNYERVAARYRLARSLPADVLGRWEDAVRRYLPQGHVRIVDVGAGTGIFAEVLPQWATASVVAVEPTAAMVRAGAVANPDVSFVQGVAERLPLRDFCADIAWLSTSLHHFTDLDQAISELARILHPQGSVLIRTYVPGRTEIPWLDAFPGRGKWESRFHTEEQLTTLFRSHSFALVDITDVVEWIESYDKYAVWVAGMQHANAMLTALTDDEIAQGLDNLRSTPMRVGRTELTLLVFARASQPAV